MSKIKVEHCPSGKGDDFKQHIFVLTTGGSDTTRSEFEHYRQAGATARMMLINATAKRFGVHPAICKTDNGYIIVGEKRISFGEVATEAATLPVPAVTLKEAKEWKYIGKSQKRLDTAEKINGQVKYGLDIHFEGLLTAVVAHSPVFGGKIKSFDSTKSTAVKGVRQVVQIPTGIAVIADNFWSAKKGRDLLTIEWDNGTSQNINSTSQLEEYSRLSKTKGITTQQKVT